MFEVVVVSLLRLAVPSTSQMGFGLTLCNPIRLSQQQETAERLQDVVDLSSPRCGATNSPTLYVDAYGGSRWADESLSSFSVGDSGVKPKEDECWREPEA